MSSEKSKFPADEMWELLQMCTHAPDGQIDQNTIKEITEFVAEQRAPAQIYDFMRDIADKKTLFEISSFVENFAM